VVNFHLPSSLLVLQNSISLILIVVCFIIFIVAITVAVGSVVIVAVVPTEAIATLVVTAQLSDSQLNKELWELKNVVALCHAGT
jgi:hypothetical protein